MSYYGYDSFVRADQMTWGTADDGQTWAIVRNAMTWAIVSNKGACNVAVGGFCIFRLGSLGPANQNIRVRVVPADTTSNTGVIGRFVSNANFYYCVLNAGTLTIGKDVAGTFTTLANPSFSYSAGTAYWLHFVLNGTALSANAWADGSLEPGNMLATATDSSHSSGGFGLGSDSISLTNTQFDQFSAQTLSPTIGDGYGGVFL